MVETRQEQEEMQDIQVETLAKLYLEAHPGDNLNRQAIRRFANWMVRHG